MKTLESSNAAILALATLALAACSPVYRTNYNLIPPATAQGQTCVMAVKSMSDTCMNNCSQMSRSCRSFGTGVSLGYGFSNTRGYRDPFYNSSILDDRDCSPRQCEETCLASARNAHLSCGGTITEEVVCTANCPKP